MIAGTSPKVIGGAGRRWRRRGWSRPICSTAPRAPRIDAFLFPDVDGEGAADHYPDRRGARDADRGRLDRHRAGRRHGEVPAARGAYRLHLLGDRRGIRADRLRGRSRSSSSRSSCACSSSCSTRRTSSGCSPRAGLATQFGVQALINMAVNTGLAPSKGMTLPFICYGGSSMIALVDRHGVAAGLHAAQSVSDALALCRAMERRMTQMRGTIVLAAGRHRRAHGPGRGAGRRTDAARAPRRADQRRARRALSRAVRGRRRRMSCPPGGLAGGPLGWVKARRGRCWRGRAMALRAVPDVRAGGGDRLRRLSGAAGAAGGVRREHPDRGPRTECGARPGQPAGRGPGRCDRDLLSPRSSGWRRSMRGQDASGRQSGARGGAGAARRSPIRCWRRTASSACS